MWLDGLEEEVSPFQEGTPSFFGFDNEKEWLLEQ